MRGAKRDKCPVGWNTLVAVAFVESGLTNGRIGRLSKNGLDFGLMQINAATAEGMRLDTARLLRDEEYSMRAACRVLAYALAARPDSADWVGAYNTGPRWDRPAVRRRAHAYAQKVRAVAAIAARAGAPQ